MKMLTCSLVISLLLSACTTPNFDTQALRDTASPASPKWSTFASSSLIQANWIAQFNDTTLSKLVLEAQQNNHELQSLAATIDQSKALTRQAGAALLPTAGLNLTKNRQAEAGFRTDSSSAALEVSWELDIWGRIRSERKAAHASAKAVIADYQFAQYSLAASVAHAYFTAIDAHLQAKIIEQSEDNLERIYDYVRLQAEEGIASQQDLAVSRSDLASIRSQRAIAGVARRDALRALELLLGRYPEADIELSTSLPKAPVLPGAGLPAELLERRPDLIAAEQRVAAAFYIVNATKTARLPSLSLTALYGGSANELSKILDRDNRSWSTDAGLLTPIFQGGALQAQVENANAEQRAAIANYGQAALNAFNDVETSLDAGIALAEQERHLQTAYVSANEAYTIATVRFDEGDIDLLDVLSVEQRVFERQMELMTAKRTTLEQRVNLYLALGGSWN